MNSIAAELTPLDQHFAAFICRLADNTTEADDQLLRFLAAQVCAALRSGDVCLNLASVADLQARVSQKFPDTSKLPDYLYKTGVVGKPGEYKPLILDDAGRLYFYRYHNYEQSLATALLQRADKSLALDESVLEAGLKRYFPTNINGYPDDQQRAAVTALRQQLCIICGGPGTGKTSTVVRILALMLEQPLQDKPLRIALAAPTGKAAARMKESILQAKQTLPCDEQIKNLLPDKAVTLHSLLGYRHNSAEFKHNQANPLPVDLLVVDEVSMVSLPLMAKLLDALPATARLILLGDRDQLASVEAGAVLGDICPPAMEMASSSSPLKSSICILSKSYRFGEQKDIANLATAVNLGDSRQAIDLLSCQSAQLSFNQLPPYTILKQKLKETILGGLTPCLQAKTAAEALQKLADFRILTPLRQGMTGVSGLNQLVEELLAAEKLITVGKQWYKGRPVMITVNAPQLQLFNGDIGIVWSDPVNEGQLRTCFAGADGQLKWLAPSRLPDHETAFAHTIHKSQGSEFTNLLMLLPEDDNPLLTRELLYTGITRARKKIEIWGKKELLPTIIARRTARSSGLKDALWGEADDELL